MDRESIENKRWRWWAHFLISDDDYHSLTYLPAYKITIYQPGYYGKKKSIYMKSGNAIGKACGMVDLLNVLRDEMLQQPNDGVEKCAWMSGADVVMIMALEAMEIENDTNSARGQ